MAVTILVVGGMTVCMTMTLQMGTDLGSSGRLSFSENGITKSLEGGDFENAGMNASNRDQNRDQEKYNGAHVLAQSALDGIALRDLDKIEKFEFWNFDQMFE